jgi:hypothetical protein
LASASRGASRVLERRGFGDEIWRLALAGDSESLRGAAELLLGDPDDLDYDAHRARAFALAIEGNGDRALAELNEGWTEDWPFPSAYATDVARVRYLAGDYEHALDALQLAVDGAERIEPGVPELATDCVRRSPRLWPRALRLALAGGTAPQRAGAAWAVFRARIAG